MLIKGLIFPGGREPVLEGDGFFLCFSEMTDFLVWSTLRE
jgi:hypothetical protein